MLADFIAVLGYYNPDLFHWEKTGIEVDREVGPELGVTFRSTTNPKCNVAIAVNDNEIGTVVEAINQTVYGH